MTDTTTATPADANATDQAIGTLHYLDPIMLEIGLSARKLLSWEILAGQCVENAFATHRRC